MTQLSAHDILVAFNQQVRRNATPDGSGSSVVEAPLFIRWTAENGIGWSEIAWANTDETNADVVIAEQINYFSKRNQEFVWRCFDYDRPTDLGDRLLRAGFTNSGNSALMVATTDSLLSLSELPPGLEIERVTDIKGIDAFIATNEAVFGNSQEALRNSLVARLSSAPEEMEIFIATVDGVAVSAARVEFLPKREFAFLWGGGTLEQWRGRGIYRALVARRAQEAQRRGFKYLTILASHQSQPILENLGFMNLASVATFSWKPSESTATTS